MTDCCEIDVPLDEDLVSLVLAGHLAQIDAVKHQVLRNTDYLVNSMHDLKGGGKKPDESSPFRLVPRKKKT